MEESRAKLAAMMYLISLLKQGKILQQAWHFQFYTDFHGVPIEREKFKVLDESSAN